MNIRYRRIVYLSFIFIFLIITPVIILYTAGYRYNFQKNKIQKTGILILKSSPTGASIYLNGELRKEKTQARIANLLPDDYNIKIEKENFYPWQKTLPVQSRLTTFAENITLFEKNLPTEVVESNSELFSLSPDKIKIVYLDKKETGDEVWFLNFKNLKKNLIYRISKDSGEIANLEWSNDSLKILITLGPGASTGSKKYVMLNTQTDEVLIYQKLSDFYFTFKGVPANTAEASRLPDLALSSGYSGAVAVLDKKTKKLQVIMPTTAEVIFETVADIAVWSADGKKLLYADDFEIWIYDFDTSKQTFISRYSQEIKQLDWVNENYIALLLGNTIKIIELDERDQRNVVDVMATDEIKNFFINAAEQKIYFSRIVGNKKGVFELPY